MLRLILFVVVDDDGMYSGVSRSGTDRQLADLQAIDRPHSVSLLGFRFFIRVVKNVFLYVIFPNPFFYQLYFWSG